MLFRSGRPANTHTNRNLLPSTEKKNNKRGQPPPFYFQIPKQSRPSFFFLLQPAARPSSSLTGLLSFIPTDQPPEDSPQTHQTFSLPAVLLSATEIAAFQPAAQAQQSFLHRRRSTTAATPAAPSTDRQPPISVLSDPAIHTGSLSVARATKPDSESSSPSKAEPVSHSPPPRPIYHRRRRSKNRSDKKKQNPKQI